ncbi:MAG: FlgO family outer membrane protein, partial [Ignavibacteriaceae bacterium]
MIGQTISHYVIAEKLGEGGMGVVYKAHDTSLDRNVALKFLPYYLTSSPNEKERFYHEARAAAALMHPNITVVHEIGEHENQVYISMEYVEGKTLKQIIEHDGESLKITKVLDFAIQICEGLTAAHEKGVVHRDIKSDNIMVTSKGQVKIMDFGLAKISGATKLTQSGSTVGTAAYMSPEQAKGEDVDHRSDIFSFGVVLYEMLTTHLPFKGEYQSALLYSILNDDPQPLARYIDNVPQESITTQNTESKDITKQKILKLLIPVSVLILLAVIILYFNPFEFRVTQKTSSETPGKSLAVMYFENIPDPADKDHTGEMLTNLLITSLSQLKGLEVISHERLLDIQKQLGHTESKVLSPSLANEVASHAGVGTMLIGSILQKNPDLAVTTRLIEVKSGKIISSQQVTSFPTDKIFSLVDSITYLLKDQFATPEVIKPVADVTTQSTEAYRAYVEGLDLMTKLFFEDAKGAFKRAVELDPGFAMAYYYMALMKMFTGDDRYATYQTFRKAAELADNVSERDRLLILAMNYRYMGKTADEEETLIRLVKKYPHEIFPYSYLIYLYNTDLFKPEKAQEVCLDGLKFNPTAKEIWNHLAYSYIYLNRKYEALNAVYNYIKLSPAEPNPYDTKGDVYAWFGDYDSSRISYIMAINLRRDFY